MKTMSRRQFLKTGAMAVMVAPLVVPEMAKIQSQEVVTFDPAKTFGLIRAEDTRGPCKVFLNDEDVSDQCNEANDREGWVKLIWVDSHGDILCPVTFRYIYGKVRIVPWD